MQERSYDDDSVGFSNQIIVIQGETQQKKIVSNVFIPAFMSFHLRSFACIDPANLQAKLNGHLHLYLDFGWLPQNAINFILKKLRMHFSMDQSVVLNTQQSQNVSIARKDREYQMPKIDRLGYIKQFFVKKIFTARIIPYAFFTPFQLLDLQLSVELPNQIIMRSKSNNRQIEYHFLFNFMDVSKQKAENIFKCISYSESGTINYYDLAQARLYVQYTSLPISKDIYFLKPQKDIMSKLLYRYHRSLQQNQDKKIQKKQIKMREIQIKKLQSKESLQQIHTPQDKQVSAQRLKPTIAQQNQIKAFNYAHFHIPVYKFPFSALATVFFPVWMLGLINVAVFHGEPSIQDRLAVIAFIALGYVQVVSFVKQEVKSITSITFLQISLYLNFASVILILINSVSIRLDENNRIDALYYITVIIFVGSIVFPVVAYIYYKLVLERSYNIDKVFEYVQRSYKELDVNYNEMANKYFKQKSMTHQFFTYESNKYKFEQFLQRLEKQSDSNLGPQFCDCKKLD